MVSFFLLAFPALFSIVNPLGGALIFLDATETFSAKTRKELAKWIAIYSFAMITASMYVGAYVLTFFGISIPVLRAAGGIVIAAADAYGARHDLRRRVARHQPTAPWDLGAARHHRARAGYVEAPE